MTKWEANKKYCIELKKAKKEFDKSNGLGIKKYNASIAASKKEFEEATGMANKFERSP